MSRLDRYVFRIAGGAYLAALLFFTFLTVLMHLLNTVAKFADNAFRQGVGGAELAWTLAGYYTRFVPVVVTTVAPFATVIACMFAVARLQQANEIVPMLFTGRSTQRVLRPMLLLGALSGALMAACWQWVVPVVGADLLSVEAKYTGAQEHGHLVHELRSEGRFFSAGNFNAVTNELQKICACERGVLAAETTVVTASSAKWDEQRKDWRLVGGRAERTAGVTFPEWLGRPDLTPKVLLNQSRDAIAPDLLSYTDLLELAVARPSRAVRWAFHRHLTWPLANVLLLLLVLPMAVNFERGGRLWRVLVAIAFCGAYLVLDLTCKSLGERGFVHPVVAAWVPPILFGSLGAVLFGSTRS